MFLKELDVHHEGVLVGDAVLEGLVVECPGCAHLCSSAACHLCHRPWEEEDEDDNDDQYGDEDEDDATLGCLWKD